MSYFSRFCQLQISISQNRPCDLFLVLFGVPHTFQVSCNRSTIADVPIEPVKSAQNLGVIFENDLRMDDYIKNICRSVSYALYKIGHIRHFLNEKSTETLIHAFITCRLYQCNSLLYGLPDTHIARLQRIQNSAARLVTRTHSSEHITPVLSKLHWLPVKY